MDPHGQKGAGLPPWPFQIMDTAHPVASIKRFYRARNCLNAVPPHSFPDIRMAPGDYNVPYDGLNIGGRKCALSIEPRLLLTHPSEVVSALHQRPHKTTHFNTVRAQRITSHLPLSQTWSLT